MILTAKGNEVLMSEGVHGFARMGLGTGTQTETRFLTAMANEDARVPIDTRLVFSRSSPSPANDASAVLMALFHNELTETAITEIGLFGSIASGQPLLAYEALTGGNEFTASLTWTRLELALYFDTEGSYNDHPFVLTREGWEAVLDGRMSDFAYLAVGTGENTMSQLAPDAAFPDTSLQTEIDRVAVGSLTNAGAEALVEAYLDTNQGIGTLTEFGHYDAASGGTLLSYGLWPGVVKGQVGLRVTAALWSRAKEE